MSEQVIEEKQESHFNVMAFTLLVLGGIAIGTSPIFMRFADVTPSSSAFWRLALSIPLLVIWQFIDIKKNTGQPMPGANKKDIKTFIIVGFLFALDLTLWHWSVQLTSVTNSTLLANMAAVFTAIGGFLFFGERFNKTFIGGMALALFGAVSLMGHSFELEPENLPGDLLSLVTAVAYASYIIYSANARKKFSTVSIMLATSLFGSLFLMPIALSETGNFIPTTLVDWWPLFGLAWFTNVIGQSMIVYALAHLPAAFGSVTLLIQPLVAAILAWILFSEILSMYHFIGAALIISGIIVCKSGVKKKKK
ncbi:DMT family transporter [Pseudemcibacter aquimaris]|uniref:DMT family transporter n=1 Tax=Pseudemcibacter aquimaris TaxID=2857064 RepID=UPI0020137D54|nr:DMT family transporter [Pseudemcibacter aquimaris]MCC3860405.1 DMT family transporter [Pseudemcibacter aquimaris]WDU57731.1 DMT family transporter [Pseudemcibacter aquimaris]